MQCLGALQGVVFFFFPNRTASGFPLFAGKGEKDIIKIKKEGL
jgi:hypothetical protein